MVTGKLVTASTKLLYVEPRVSTGMGYRIRAGKPPLYVTNRPGQLILLPSAGREMSIGRVRWSSVVGE